MLSRGLRKDYRECVLGRVECPLTQRLFIPVDWLIPIHSRLSKRIARWMPQTPGGRVALSIKEDVDWAFFPTPLELVASYLNSS